MNLIMNILPPFHDEQLIPPLKSAMVSKGTKFVEYNDTSLSKKTPFNNDSTESPLWYGGSICTPVIGQVSIKIPAETVPHSDMYQQV